MLSSGVGGFQLEPSEGTASRSQPPSLTLYPSFRVTSGSLWTKFLVLALLGGGLLQEDGAGGRRAEDRGS